MFPSNYNPQTHLFSIIKSSNSKKTSFSKHKINVLNAHEMIHKQTNNRCTALVLFHLFMKYNSLMQVLTEQILTTHSHKTKSDKGPFLIKKEIHPSIQQYKVTGSWTDSENTAYAFFLSHNRKTIEGKEIGKQWDFFKEMSNTVKTRNMMQCKSHHLKLSNKYGGIAQIILQLEREGIEVPLQNADKSVRIYGEEKIEENESFFTDLANPFASVSFKMPYKDNQYLIPTGTSYDEHDELNNEMEEQWRASKNSIQNSANMMYSMSQWSNFPSQTSLQLKTNKKMLEMNKEWFECHRLFLLWVSKMNSLVHNSYDA